MTKLITFLKQYWVASVAVAAVGGLAISSISGDNVLGAADGKRKNNSGSINELLRDGQKRVKRATNPISPPTEQAPARDDFGLDDADLSEILKPPAIDQTALDEHNAELCEKNNSAGRSNTPLTKGTIKSVRYINPNHFYSEDHPSPVECLIAVYAKGCEEIAYYSVIASRGPNSRYGHIAQNLCKTAEKAMLDNLKATVGGALVPANGVTPGAVHNVLHTIEISR